MKERRAIRVTGIVQGVGFRPFVHRLASRWQLDGFVKNHSGTVHVEVEGPPAALDGFLEQLTGQPPPLARIDEVDCRLIEPKGDDRFHIESSAAEPSAAGLRGGNEQHVFVSPDVATCPDCLAELFDPADRRYRYPFLNCTNCGPRLTIVTAAPYDRERTTMRSFPMCPECRAEYLDPGDRRFHAQPSACPACGPQLQLLDSSGQPVNGDDPAADFASLLLDGRIGALKGLGGYHLVCDAGNESAVGELRRRKHRDDKPLAVMVPTVEAARVICEVSAAEQRLLESPRSPIVLLRKRSRTSGILPDAADSANRPNSKSIAAGVAPGNPRLGIMLPYTPLHHLLMREVDGRPLVMTSGNRSDEPIAYRDDAVRRLHGIADVFLIHDRPIHVRCDDSVVQVVDDEPLPLRRSRGYAPEPVSLPLPCGTPTLAVGGQMKATFALSSGHSAFLSHHLGDLEYYDAYQDFENDIALYEQLFAITPRAIVHDLHPDYLSTQYALRRADAESLETVAVQHHHAHMASCMAEHGLTEPVIGVTFDGTGFGTDGTVWGGEFLVGDYCSFRRAGQLRGVGMPGGDRAIREPWRMAVAHLHDAGCRFATIEPHVPPAALRMVEAMLERGVGSPTTSSAGRLCDTIAAIAGVRHKVTFEGQAAMELEWLASGTSAEGLYPFSFDETADGEHPSQPPRILVDTRPLVRAAAEDCCSSDASQIARRFHSTLVEIVSAVCGRIRETTGISAVVLTGGVFANALLTAESAAKLQQDDFRVYRHRIVPPGDGGLSLGQLAVAAAQQHAAAEKPTNRVAAAARV